MRGTVRLAQLIEKSHIKCRDFDGGQDLEAFGVSNTDGITRTAHRKSDDLGDYLVIEPGSFAYNPYRVNVGSIGLTPEGLIGVVSPAYIVFRTKDKLIPEVLLDFLKSAEGLRQINKLASGAVRKALRFEDLCEIEFPALSHGRQIEILKHKQGFNQQHGRLLAEITHQEALLAKLKQAILQEAIQGKLTADWRAAQPDVEPASQLLHRIQAEKARLIAAKKLRPEKPLPKITPAEIPFEIPQGWEWCRFGSYARFERGKFSARPRNDKRFFGGPYPFIQIGSLDSHGSVVTSSTQTLNEEGLAVSKMFEAGTIAVAIVGGTIGNLGVLGRDMCFTDSVVGVRPNNLTCQDFILLMMRHKQPVIQSVAYQRAGQPNISLPNLTDLLVPLPPLAEQAAIVARVEALMEYCRALAAEIANTRTHAAHLLQAVLKESFAPAATNG